MSGILTRVYDRLPGFLQNLVVTAYGYRIYRREYGREFERLLEQFDKQQWYSASELEAYQNEHLRGLIRHCYETVPYYRRVMDERRVKPTDIQTTADLPKLPLLTTDILENDPDSLVSSTAPRRDRIVGHTSGTTGKAKKLYYDRHVCVVKNVVDWRMKGIADVRVGDPIAHMFGRQVVSIDQRKPPFWRENKILNHLFLSAYHFSPEWWDAYIDKVQEFGPVALEGYPSTLSLLAEAFLARGLTRELRAAFVSSEVLRDYQKRSIQKAFNCEPIDSYGMAERCVFACECEKHMGLHVNDDFGICELVDQNEEPEAHDGLGRVVVTGLHNYTMPLIRYQTTDYASWSTRTCTCGRGFRVLARVAGRDIDLLVTPDGRALLDTTVYEPFEQLQSKIHESQIVQEESLGITIRIVPSKELTEEDLSYLKSEFRRHFGGSIPVEIEFVQQIERTSSGKYQWIISRAGRQVVE